MEDLFTLLSSTYTNSHTEKARKSLLSVIMHDSITQYMKKCEKFKDEYNVNDFFNYQKACDALRQHETSNKIYKYMVERQSKSLSLSTNVQETPLKPHNPYRNLTFVDFLLHFSTSLPLWTNICSRSNNGMGFNACNLQTEYFSNVQNSISNNNNEPSNSLRIEEFLVTHRNLLLTLSQESRDIINLNRKSLLGRSKKNTNEAATQCFLNFKENWKNKGEKNEKFDDINETTMNCDNEKSDDIINETTICNEIMSVDIDMGCNHEKHDDILEEINETTMSNRISSFDINMDCNNAELIVTKDSSMQIVKTELSITYEHNYSKSLTEIVNNSIENHFALDVSQISEININHSTPTNSFTESTELLRPEVIKQPPKKISNSKPSKYINPCPRINIIHNRPVKKGSFKDPIIKNGNIKTKTEKVNVEKNSNKYVVRSTCLFDCGAEVMNQAMKNYPDFYTFVTNSTKDDVVDSSFLKMILEYVNDGILSDLYKKRLKFLLRNGNLVKDAIHCNQNIVPFFKKIMANNESFVMKKKCTHCEFEESTHHYTTSLHINDQCNDNAIEIQELLKQKHSDGQELCKECKHRVNRTYEWKNYIAIYPKNKSDKIKIKNLQTMMCIQDKYFFLAGVMGYTPPAVQNSQNHYIAYRKFINDEWQIRDDKLNKILGVGKSTSARIGLLFYVRNTFS